MTETSVYFFSGCIMLIFLILGGLTGFTINWWLTFNSVEESEPYGVHPEFFDEHGNFINEELLSLRFVEEEDDED